jgi:DNA invertase Pin-like site-specific DNA recombinase
MDHPIDIQPGDGGAIKRAAQYTRMSTEHQKYSTENQTAAISDYARLHGMTIVRTYSDKGRSGLTFNGRDALKQLIADVVAGDVPFELILVFDVSRWGRFQDADESAYYEFICRHAGVDVRYCAEPFENDGSMLATLLKNIKRLMAGEYSRELSNRIFAAKCRLTTLGFRQGGTPGYGLRRLLIDEQRKPKFQLAPGERKAIQTDRILLVPGPDHEVQVVRQIFEMFVSQRLRQTQIARVLNQKCFSNEMGRPWHYRTVHQILTNDKYIGNNVYNRESFKLRKKRIQNSPSAWVRADRSFEAIVDVSAFQAARRILDAKSNRLSKDEMLNRLRSCFEKYGRLTGAIINNCEGMPCAVTYMNNFGTLRRAYALVGYFSSEPFRENGVYWKAIAKRRILLQTALEMVRNAGMEVRLNAGGSSFVLDGSISIAIRVITCSAHQGAVSWDLTLVRTSKDITVAARLDGDGEALLDYYLFPKSALKNKACIRLASVSRPSTKYDAYRCKSLDSLLRLISQVKRERRKQRPRTRATVRGKPRKRDGRHKQKGVPET